MDLYFRGWLGSAKGLTPDHVARARSFYDRALAVDPDNVKERLWIGGGRRGRRRSYVTDTMVALAAAEEIDKRVVSIPDHARGRNVVRTRPDIMTERAAQGM